MKVPFCENSRSFSPPSIFRQDKDFCEVLYQERKRLTCPGVRLKSPEPGSGPEVAFGVIFGMQT